MRGVSAIKTKIHVRRKGPHRLSITHKIHPYLSGERADADDDVGKVGGKQPIWISPGCEATEVAREIMHALGFVHEQNRSERDQFLEVFPQNIEEPFIYNFDKLPPGNHEVQDRSAHSAESRP